MISLTKGRIRGCKDSIGGLDKVYLFPFVNYSRSQIVVTDLVLTSFPATDIYEFEVDNQPTFDNKGNENEGGKYYTENISLSFSGINVYNEFEKFLKQDFRIIIQDRNGIFRMLGAYNGLTSYDLKQDIGSSHATFSGYTTSFEGQEEQPSLFLNDLNLFTIIENEFLQLENGEYALTEMNELIRIE